MESRPPSYASALAICRSTFFRSRPGCAFGDGKGSAAALLTIDASMVGGLGSTPLIRRCRQPMPPARSAAIERMMSRKIVVWRAQSWAGGESGSRTNDHVFHIRQLRDARHQSPGPCPKKFRPCTYATSLLTLAAVRFFLISRCTRRAHAAV